MIHFLKTKFFFIIIFILFSACSSVPKNTKNSCAIFEERYLWYKHTKAVEKKWGVPVYIQLAFVKRRAILIGLQNLSELNFLKLFPINVNPAHLAILRQSKVLGSSIKKKLEIN